nr:BlaI/MecI/CopY family transcriptional regulator [Motilibacter aurantiacus]
MGDLERDVMAQLWGAPGPLTVREVHERLSASRQAAYTTVMTVLQRLARKGLAVEERAERAYRYSPAASREELAAELMVDALGDVDEQARAAALVHFVQQVSPSEAQALREALDGLGRPRGRRGRRGG